MKVTEAQIISFRMQVCVACKQSGDNFYNGEVCRGSKDDIKACIDANLHDGVEYS